MAPAHSRFKKKAKSTIGHSPAPEEPQPSPRHNKKAKHDTKVLEEAVEAVRSKKMGLRKAAAHFNISKSTLSDKVLGKTVIKYERPTLLTADEEKHLVTWILKMAEVGFAQTTDDLRAKAKAIRDLHGESPKNTPSPSWAYRFFDRHPQARTALSPGTERAHVKRTMIENWFAGLQKHLTSIDPSLLSDPSRIFNSDEIGFKFDPKARKVVAWQGVKDVYNMAPNNKSQVTVLATMSAAGLYLPPLLIYPFKRNPAKNMLDGFPEAHLQISDNGWITSAIFYSWMRDSFIPATNHIKKPLLLLVDGHASHKSIETSQICEKNQIILYCMQPHTSHLVQPLNQAFFGSIKSAWATASGRHIEATGDAAVGIDSFARILQPVWQSSTTITNAESSYRAAGIFPFAKILQSINMKPSQVSIDTQLSENRATSPQGEKTTLTEAEDEEPTPPEPVRRPEDLGGRCEPVASLPSLNDDEPQVSSEPAAEGAPPMHHICEPAAPLPPLNKDAPQLDTVPSTSTGSDNGLISAEQIEAIKNFGLFITDDMGRNGFLRCIQALSSNTSVPANENDLKFKEMTLALKHSFQKEIPTTQSRAPLILDNITRVPSIAKKGRPKTKKIMHTPTIHNELSGATHRGTVVLKQKEKEKEEKSKLIQKTETEEDKRKRQEHEEVVRLRREFVKQGKHEKAAELVRKIQERRAEALIKKLERENTRKRQHSDSNHGPAVEREVQRPLEEADKVELSGEEVTYNKW